MAVETNELSKKDGTCARPKGLQPPRFAERFGAHAVGWFVVDERARLVVELDLTIQVQRDVRSVAGNVCVASSERVCLRL